MPKIKQPMEHAIIENNDNFLLPIFFTVSIHVMPPKIITLAEVNCNIENIDIKK